MSDNNLEVKTFVDNLKKEGYLYIANNSVEDRVVWIKGAAKRFVVDYIQSEVASFKLSDIDLITFETTNKLTNNTKNCLEKLLDSGYIEDSNILDRRQKRQVTKYVKKLLKSAKSPWYRRIFKRH